MANQISKIYGVKEYLKTSNWDNSIDNTIKENLFEKINNEEEYNKNMLRKDIIKALKESEKEIENGEGIDSDVVFIHQIKTLQKNA